MRLRSIVAALAATAIAGCGSQSPGAPTTAPGTGVDPQLAAHIASIRAVDNHAHVVAAGPADTDYDALPLDGIAPFELPAMARPDHPQWAVARQALAGKPPGDGWQPWVLERIGTEVVLANRVAMSGGLDAPRFRWVSYADALIYPLATTLEAKTTPDREKLFPLEVRLLERYLAALKIATVPATLDAYLRDVVTPTLEAQKKAGCVAVKFEAAYLRSLDFGDVPQATAAKVYAAYVNRGAPPHAEYKALQDFLFRYVAREAGRLGMALHIHSFDGVGSYYDAGGADPALLEPAINDPALRATSFVIIHGGGSRSAHTTALLWKPNVYADMSLMTLLYTPSQLAAVLKPWLAQFPEKVLFGSDASPFGPDLGWEVAAMAGTANARAALGLALTDLMRGGEMSRERAMQLATMVMRGNANQLYALGLD